MEFTTGNCLNCSYVMGSEMPYYDQNKIYNQNALILGFDPFQDTWGFGYGFQKILYNKFSVRPVVHNEKRMISYGIKFLHLNKSMSFDKTFNLVTRLNVEYGKRRGFTYLFAGVSLNYFVAEKGNGEEVYSIKSLRIPAGKLFDLASTFWPGYTIGVQLL
jgi:hypothetical protein